MSIHLDELMDVKQAAQWLKLSEREVLAKSKGRNPTIPAYWLNRRVVRFHPRAIIAKMARDNGVTPDQIASMLGSQISKSR